MRAKGNKIHNSRAFQNEADPQQQIRTRPAAAGEHKREQQPRLPEQQLHGDVQERKGMQLSIPSS